MSEENPEQMMPILLEEDECLDPPPSFIQNVADAAGENVACLDAARAASTSIEQYEAEQIEKSLHSNSNNCVCSNTSNNNNMKRQQNIIHRSKESQSLKASLYADEFIAEVDRHYYKVAGMAVSIWISLVTLSCVIGYRLDSMVELDGIEKSAPMVASLLLGMSLVSCVLPQLVGGKKRCMSGVIVCAVTVQSIAFVTDLLMATFPTPVLIDPITGAKAHLMRYCEWTPLAFTMAFLTESCRIDDQRGMISGKKRSGRLALIIGAMSSRGGNETDQNHDLLSGVLLGKHQQGQGAEDKLKQRVSLKMRSAYYLGVTQGMSTFCGWLFPFCSNIFIWCICMVTSCYLFSIMWKRLHARKAAFAKLEQGSILSEQEMYNWSKLSLGLLKTCTYVWSCLVIVFFVCNFGPLIFPQSSLLNAHGLSMMLESTIDVLFKAIYLLIVIEVHDSIFDPSARAERRLEELRQMLSVVWDNSSDVIGISVRGVSGDVTTMLSPTYMKMYSDVNNDADRGSALSFELDARCFQPGADADVVPANMYDLHFKDLVPGGRPYKSSKSQFLREEETKSIAELVIRSWESQEPKSLLMHDLVRKRGTPKVNIRCEANITRMEENALVIVVRDISERFRRFEAEKKVISETTARLKDAAANRFTRHEVKNGLLSAIGLCDSLNECVTTAAVKTLQENQVQDEAVKTLQENQVQDEAEDIRESENASDNDSSVTKYLFELDKTLHEILDTILAEAMARDVVHEVYEPKLERVDVPSLLADSMNLNFSKKSTRRFPITTYPSPLPNYALDPQLLKYIHRNAISNASKYGKKGGIVTTNVKYEAAKGMLKMEVVNLPGEQHLEILKLGKLAQELVFSPRRRLTIHCTDDSNNNVSASHSSGDGAWIMHKCAKTLGGTCGIKFEEHGTTFSFTCPAKVFDEKLANTNMKYEDFKLPKNLQAIAIDDSKIQRKLLSRFFMFAGVPEDNIHILGATAEEINGFCDWSITFVDEHPDDYILMVVDENLDVQEEQVGTKHNTVSGSGSVAEIRRRLLVDQERRLFALIRSANDSASDVTIYNARAHGYLAKAPVKKNHVLEVLAPLWLRRFPRFEALKFDPSNGDGIRASIDEVVVTMDDLMGLIDEIDCLSLLDKDDLHEKWPIISEKLHVLKGDLLVMSKRGRSLDEAIAAIGDLRGSHSPERFIGEWNIIRLNLMKGC